MWENACKPGADIQVVLDAMAKVPEFAPADAVE
jgi:tRNA-dihydrouridine synthase A